MHLHPSTTPASLERLPNGRLRFVAAGPSGEETVVECDHVMAATGEEAQVVGHRRGRWPCL